MTEQAIEAGYETVRQIAAYFGVGEHVVYRNIKHPDPALRWPCSRTSPSPKAPVRFSARHKARIEELLERNGERGPELRPMPEQSGVRDPRIDRGMRRLKR